MSGKDSAKRLSSSIQAVIISIIIITSIIVKATYSNSERYSSTSNHYIVPVVTLIMLDLAYCGGPRAKTGATVLKSHHIELGDPMALIRMNKGRGSLQLLLKH